MQDGGKKIVNINHIITIIDIIQDNSAADQLKQSEKKFEEVTQAIAKKNAKITELVSLEEK